jgi:predicted DNA-binding protein (MmcQ/YjbR family)
MYACAGLEPGKHWLSFKTASEDFAELVERPGASPARYLARAHWIAIEPNCSLSPDEIKQLVRKAHMLVFTKLPKKTQLELTTRARGKKASKEKSAG